MRSLRIWVVALLSVVAGSALAEGPAPRTDERFVVAEGGRTRANAFTRLAVPEVRAEPPVIVDVMDPWGQTIWTGATRGDAVEFFTRDWADGEYTVRFTPGGERTLKVETAFFEQVRARAGLMLRRIESRRDADGLPPKAWAGASNLLQRVITQFVWLAPADDVTGNLYHCEQVLKMQTGAMTVRILGSGASEYLGYEGAYRPFRRERVMVFLPPNACIEFAEHAERKLERWGYSFRDVEHVFISHEHRDHLDEAAVAAFAQKRREAGLSPPTVHSGRTVCKMIRAELAKRGAPDLVKLDELEPGDESGGGEYRVKAVLATHTAGPDPLCYIIQWRGVTLYYGVDSGYPRAATLAELKKHRFDVFIHDCTVASGDDGVTHQDLGDMMLLVGTLRAAGAIDTWTRVVTMHQGPQGPQVIPDYNVLQAQVGFDCAYDGMPIGVAYEVKGRAE
jgi:L-ascorbate metabolism protein UlaG (beta-lactamase superfamily)